MDRMPKLDLEEDLGSSSTMPPVFDYLEDEEEIIVDDGDGGIPVVDDVIQRQYRYPRAMRVVEDDEYPPPCPTYISNKKRGVHKPQVEQYAEPKKIFLGDPDERCVVYDPDSKPLTEAFNPEDINPLQEEEGMPYCGDCNTLIKSWPSYDYHIRRVHLDYRPFQCIMCPKVSFYTELEGRYHMTNVHPTSRTTPLLKLYDHCKEEDLLLYFENALVLQKEGINSLYSDVKNVQQAAEKQIEKFSRLRFGIPHSIQANTILRDSSVQTGMHPSNNYIAQPVSLWGYDTMRNIKGEIPADGDEHVQAIEVHGEEYQLQDEFQFQEVIHEEEVVLEEDQDHVIDHQQQEEQDQGPVLQEGEQLQHENGQIEETEQQQEQAETDQQLELELQAEEKQRILRAQARAEFLNKLNACRGGRAERNEQEAGPSQSQQPESSNAEDSLDQYCLENVEEVPFMSEEMLAVEEVESYQEEPMWQENGVDDDPENPENWIP